MPKSHTLTIRRQAKLAEARKNARQLFLEWQGGTTLNVLQERLHLDTRDIRDIIHTACTPEEFYQTMINNRVRSMKKGAAKRAGRPNKAVNIPEKDAKKNKEELFPTVMRWCCRECGEDYTTKPKEGCCPKCGNHTLTFEPLTTLCK
jgi:rubrerythrin